MGRIHRIEALTDEFCGFTLATYAMNAMMLNCRSGL